MTEKREYPCSPVLLPSGRGVMCPYDGKRVWNPARDEHPNCIPCAAAWHALDVKAGKVS